MTIGCKETVAVVEDDPVARVGLAALIASIGMECHESASAEEFLECGPNLDPSCIVLDLCLPGMNGQDLLERLVRCENSPPVVVVTGFATIPLVVNIMRGGAYTVLEKSCRTQELRETIQKAVARHHYLLQKRHQTELQKQCFETLSEVERRVAKGIAEGTSNSDLSQLLNLGLRTVEKRRQQVFRKLKVDNLPAFIEVLYRVAPDYVLPLPREDAASDFDKPC